MHDIVGDRRLVQVNEVTRPALVLGSGQDDVVVDPSRLRSRGIDLARRRSGGGAVLLLPGEHVWLDVVLPAADRLWSDDVTEASWWLGERWAEAVARASATEVDPLDSDPAAELSVHRHGVRGRELARLVCFAGVGPGEVSLDGRKLVGISQRRTRSWVRFQCVIHLRWDPLATLELMAVRPEGLEQVLQHEVAALDAGRSQGWDAVGGLLRQLG